MDQNIEARTEPIDLEKVMDAVTRDGTSAFIPRDGKEGVYILSIAAYHRLDPPPQWLRDSWARAKDLGLDKMTMDEIDEEIAAARREQAEEAAAKR